MENEIGNIELRDYFAGKALSGFFANNSNYISAIDENSVPYYELIVPYDKIVKICYSVADAMLKERGKSNGGRVVTRENIVGRCSCNNSCFAALLDKGKIVGLTGDKNGNICYCLSTTGKSCEFRIDLFAGEEDSSDD